MPTMRYFATATFFSLCVAFPSLADTPFTGHWRSFRAQDNGVGPGCFAQMANIGNQSRAGRHDWTIFLAFTKQMGLLFILGDADGSTKDVTSLRVEFEGGLEGDSPLDMGPKLAHNHNPDGPNVAARINLHEGKGDFVNFIGGFSMATSITVFTNARTYAVPIDGMHRAMGVTTRVVRRCPEFMNIRATI
jgi:hypothetical protein